MTHSILLSILLFTIFISFAFNIVDSVCPPEQLLRPCHCSDGVVTCRNILSQYVLCGVFRRLGDITINDFILKNSSADDIAATLVAKNKIRRLAIIDTSLAQLFDSVPSSDNLLSQLSLENVTFRFELNFSQLKTLKKLEVLMVRDTEIQQLGKEFNAALSDKIRLVAFRGTRTQSLDLAFVDKTIEDIRIQNSFLTKLARQDFPHPGLTIQSLSFDGNQIDTFPSNLFELMPNLIRVTLAKNNIKEVREAVFGNIFNQLRFLILEGNPIKCDCSIMWLTTKSKDGKTITGKCAEPPKLAGKNISELEPSNFSKCGENIN